jgi:copper chaperone NosL
VLALIGASALLLALDRGASRSAGPRAARLGEEECAACRMIVSDPRFAAQRVLGPEEAKVYDDTGCLLQEMAEDRSGTAWFADSETGEWIEGSEVRFVRTTVTTPMGFGLAARRARSVPEGNVDLEAAIRSLTVRAPGSREEKKP